MPRCSCVTGQAVLVQGIPPIVVTGDGTADRPFTVSFAYNGLTSCDGIAACIGDHLGAGLVYQGGKFRIRISNDPDNIVAIGTDSGVKAPAQTPAPADCFAKNIDTACTPTRLLIGAARGALLAVPGASPGSVDYCWGQGFDFHHEHVSASADGVAMVMEEEGGYIDPCRTAWQPWSNWTIPTTPQYTASQAYQVTASVVEKITSIAGDIVNPTTGTCTATNLPGQSKFGGWWGWNAHNYSFVTLDYMLWRNGGRMMMIADCNSMTDEAVTPALIAREAANVAAAIRSGVRACAQKWMLIGIRHTDNIAAIKAAGFEPIMISQAEGPATNTTTMPWTLATLTAAGVKWVAPDRQYADSVFTAYKNAPMNVLMYRCERHFMRERVRTLGLCGYLSHDPAYTRGPSGVPDGREYRNDYDPWRVSVRSPGVGGLSHWTSRGQFLTQISRYPRGYTQNLSELTLAPGFGEVGLYPTNATSVLPRQNPSVLCGWACPIRNATNYTIEWEFNFMSATTQGKLGVSFGNADDRDIFVWPADWPYYQSRPQMLMAYVKGNGNVGLAWHDYTASPARQYLNGTGISSNYNIQEVTITGGLTVGTWYKVRLEVQPSLVRITALPGDARQTILLANLSSWVGQWRGPYFHVVKEEAIDNVSVTNQFTGGFRNMVYTPNP